MEDTIQRVRQTECPVRAGTRIIHLHGRLDHRQSKFIGGAFRACLNDPAVTTIQLDCSLVTGADSSGLSLIEALRLHARRCAKRFGVINGRRILPLYRRFDIPLLD